MAIAETSDGDGNFNRSEFTKQRVAHSDLVPNSEFECGLTSLTDVTFSLCANPLKFDVFIHVLILSLLDASSLPFALSTLGRSWEEVI